MNETGHSIHIARLIAKQALGRITEAEAAEISQWVSTSEANRKAYEDLLDAEKQKVHFGQLRGKDTEAAFRRVHERYQQGARRKRLIRLLPYAAAAILVAIAGTLLYVGDQIADRQAGIAHVQDVQPGGNRATLTLADGRTVDLSEAQDGIIVGEEINYTDGSEVMDAGKESLVSDVSRLMSLSTPKGGTYQVTLPDGSNVWLNANSTLKYPSRFDREERLVELEGEGYFDVVKGDVPFRVMSKGQTVEVLGTQFNVSAYADEPETKTTLVEGAVRLQVGATGARLSLMPGEQGALTANILSKKQVDVEQYIAWKEGYFAFSNTSIVAVMKQLGRWYDIEVHYEGAVPTDRFDGEISRELTLQQVLNGLATTQINYRVEGKTLTIINHSKPN